MKMLAMTGGEYAAIVTSAAGLLGTVFTFWIQVITLKQSQKNGEKVKEIHDKIRDGGDTQA